METGELQLNIPGEPIPECHPALLALPPGVGIQCGDTVLASRDQCGILYVFAVSCPAPNPFAAEWTLADDTVVRRRRTGEAVTLTSPDQEFQLTYQAGTVTLRGASEGLRLAIPKGDLTFFSAGKISLDAGESIELRVGESASCQSAASQRLSTHSKLVVTQDNVSVTTDAVMVRSRQIVASADDSVVCFKSLTSVVDRLQLTSSSVVTSVGSALHQAGEFFLSIAETLQLQAGRLRGRVKDRVDLRGGTTDISAEGDVRIQGEHVHLG